MATIVQLSDLHLLAAPAEQPAILDALVEALGRDRQARGRPDLLAVTGDVFDSVSLEPRRATGAFCELFQRIQAALGGPVPTIIVPGNHDRRRVGLVGPHRDDLFDALHDALDDTVCVHGTSTPFLSRVVPPSFHGLPLWAVAYDSTFLERGLLSAGGLIRQEDLLHAACQIGDQHPEWPVLFLLHHHLVPTPLTDLHPIEANEAHPALRWGLHSLLPRLVAHADREELTMTALGAGTALSTLHTLGRAVLVLHGHKHYATARILDGTLQGQGDLLIVSAGSCGTAQAWNPVDGLDAARLWPSFNVIELEGDRLAAQTVSFGWKGSSAGEVAYRSLVAARRSGSQWWAEPLPPAQAEGPAVSRLSKNVATFTLEPSRDHGPSRWDYLCERQAEPIAETAPSRYVESIDGAADAQLERLDAADGEGRPGTEPLPVSLSLRLGETTRYRVRGALRRRLDHRQRSASPYAWLGLMNRYASETARIVVRGLGSRSEEAFASATDLGTGLERPLPLVRSEGAVGAELGDCPPRTLLRVYWPLARTP